ncbi:trypsin-like peptidase domain-containing protein [Streptomyces sp. NPDC005402]|uniref:trypsin-like peptidase domain-containing protein n=1 Tax=Streptomyces sp. NPDC005402 TaxID=3155338 RepID=UPI0033A22B63
MRWQADDDPDARIRKAWVTLHTRGAIGEGLGAGVVVADGFLLTCAHVINAALGRPKLAAAEPTSRDMLEVAVSFPGLGSERHAVELAGWLAPRLDGEQWWDGDLALLKFSMGASDITPVPVRETSGRRLSTWYAHGAPRSLVDVYIQASMGPWYILDPGYAPLKILPGHSGAPLWDRERGCVTGLVVSTEPDNLRSYAIRASEMMKLLATAGAFPTLAAEMSDPRMRVRRGELITALDVLSERKLQRCAERLGRVLNLPWFPPTCADLVDAAMYHTRGMPTLLSTLTAHGAVAQQVRDVAARLGPVHILTPDEYEDLIGLLGPAAHLEVRAAARRAVPHFTLPVANVPLGTLIEDLEDRRSEPGVVPPVIQVIEEVAAARQENGDALREWSQRTSDRLGVSPEAMQQCRWSAKSRATARTSQPVLRVWLWVSTATEIPRRVAVG